MSDEQNIGRLQQQRVSATTGSLYVQPQAATQQQATQSRSIALPSPPSMQPTTQQMQHRLTSQGLAGVTLGIPQQESSLDRVTAALQQALDAATTPSNGKPLVNGKRIGSKHHGRQSAESAWLGHAQSPTQGRVGLGSLDQDDKLQGIPSLVCTAHCVNCLPCLACPACMFHSEPAAKCAGPML